MVFFITISSNIITISSNFITISSNFYHRNFKWNSQKMWETLNGVPIYRRTLYVVPVGCIPCEQGPYFF